MSGSLVRIIESVVAGLILTVIVQAVSGAQSWLVIGAVFALGSLATLFVAHQWRGASTSAEEEPERPVKTGGGKVSGGQLMQMVHGQMSADKAETVTAVARRIHPRITARDAEEIVRGTLSSDRLTIIKALAPHMQGPLSPRDVDNLLRGMQSEDRKEASISLANKVR